MSQFPHDEFAKGLLGSLLAPFGKVKAAHTISSETREIDVYFQPDSVPTNLGLPSKFAATAAAFEAYRNPVDLVEIPTSCQSHQKPCGCGYLAETRCRLKPLMK
jgi:hypothetical protein